MIYFGSPLSLCFSAVSLSLTHTHSAITFPGCRDSVDTSLGVICSRHFFKQIARYVV